MQRNEEIWSKPDPDRSLFFQDSSRVTLPVTLATAEPEAGRWRVWRPAQLHSLAKQTFNNNERSNYHGWPDITVAKRSRRRRNRRGRSRRRNGRRKGRRKGRRRRQTDYSKRGQTLLLLEECIPKHVKRMGRLLVSRMCVMHNFPRN